MLYIIIPIVVLLLIFLFAGYVKAPPNKAAIITGLSKNLYREISVRSLEPWI